MKDDEGFCVLFYRPKTRRVYHWHWPRKAILACTKGAAFAREHSPGEESQ